MHTPQPFRTPLDNHMNAPIQLPGRFFLWPGELLYIGQGFSAELHAHHSFQISITHQQPMAFRLNRHHPYEITSSVLVKSHVPHELETYQHFGVFIWVEPQSQQGRRLFRLLGSSPALTGASLDASLPLPADLWQRIQNVLISPRLADARLLLDQLLPPEDILDAPKDSRIEALLAHLQRMPLSTQAHSLLYLASQVSLSPSRLRHLFAEEVGLSFHRYLLWRRLITAILLSSQTGSLTIAAHQAGFADSAHLSRTMRATFGVKPSDIFKRNHLIQVHTLASESD